MKVTQLLTKTSKTAPADEQAKNAQLLIKAGYIYKDSAGVYAMLPLGFMVLNKIIAVIREEMNAIGGQEVLMTTLQRRELWEKTDRWDDEQVDIWFKSKLKNDTEVGLGWSHEEQMTDMMLPFVSSYRDLPRYVYQFQNKLRNETRAKSGILRTREFIMKDLYSFSRSDEEHAAFYEQAKHAYTRIFERLGIGEWTYLTFASGGAFAEFSHEFQTICDAGEDIIYLHHGKKVAINEEVLNEKVMKQLGVTRDELEKVKAAEVGNIFNLGTAKSEALGLKFTDENGQYKAAVMGSYGIGPARVMGVIAERFADDRGLVWPKEIAPFRVYLAGLGGSEAVEDACEVLNKHLTDAGIGVLYDDRKAISAGEKFADADLLGIPFRVVVSEKTIAAKKYELKARTAQETKLLDLEELIRTVA